MSDPKAMPTIERWLACRTTATMAIAFGLGLAACGSGEDTPSEPTEDRNVSAFVSLFGGDVGDYEPVSGPAELARRSDLVVVGRIERIVEGRTFGKPGPEGVTENVVMQVVTTATLKGRLPANSGGRVYVELFGAEDPSGYAKVAPVDLPVLLYLHELPESSPIPGDPVVNAGAGRPDGQPLYTVHPQGFLLDDGTSVYQVQESSEFPRASLEQFEPSDRRFPANERPVG